MDSRTDSIASLISRADDGRTLDEKHVARYRANVSSSMTIHGLKDINLRSIIYNVGRINDGDLKINLSSGGTCVVDSSFELTDAVKADIESAVRKVNGQAGRWDYADFNGPVAVLASALALYRHTGSLSMDDIKGGKDVPLKYEALRTRGVETSADSGKVYIPASVNRQATPNTISALVAAVSAFGQSVVTDVVLVDPTTNTAKVPSASGRALAIACYDALALLGKFYDANGVGELFAFAYTVGTHHISTVHGHTDEGGFVRELLRRVRFQAPFGGLSIGVGNFAGLPKPTGETGFVKLVDAIAIQSAGVATLADPMVTLDGVQYPTTIVSGHKYSNAEAEALEKRQEEKSDPNIGSDGDALDNANKIADTIHEFAALYSCLLGRMFDLQGGGHIVRDIMLATYTSTLHMPYRHLKYKVVNPYFWVEATGSTRVNCSDMAMQKAGFGRLAAQNESGSYPCFHGGVKKQMSNTTTTVGSISWVGARRHALLQHLMLHPKNGLSHVKVRSVAQAKLSNYGHGQRKEDGSRPEAETIPQKVYGNKGIDEMLWGRGHSPLITPGEMLYTGKNIGVAFEHLSGTDIRRPVLNHFPDPEELSGEIEFKVGPLECLGVDVPDAIYSAEDKRRATAAKAISEARLKITLYRDVEAMMPINLDGDDQDDDIEGGENTINEATHQGDPQEGQQQKTVAGQRLDAVGSHGTQSVPRLGQQDTTEAREQKEQINEKQSADLVVPAQA